MNNTWNEESYLYSDIHDLGIRVYLIPKTGTSSLRSLLEKKLESFSFLPDSKTAYFKICFVRNPYDRLVSAWRDKSGSDSRQVREFYQKLLGGYKDNFKKFVIDLKHKPEKFSYFQGGANGAGVYCDRHFMPQHNLFPVNNMDFIGRFESFQEDFNKVCDKLDKPRINLPVLNASTSDNADFMSYYDEDTLKIASEIYAKDIERFGYKFEE